MNIEDISSHLEIRALMTNYCRGVDRGNKSLLLSVYHDDAHDERGADILSADIFVDRLVDRMDESGFIGQHHITNIHIELDGDSARAESYVWSLAPDRENPGRIIAVSGRYLDRLERREGCWKIAWRQFILDYAEPQPDGRAWPRTHLFKRGGRRQNDPSDHFFDPPPSG